jgi:multidrug efflux system membrane fusion protein
MERWQRRSLRIGGIGAGLALAALVAVHTASAQHAAVTASPPPANPAVPVLTTAAKRQDVPVYASGVGTVQAFESVLVRARVDGNLMSFPLTEGQAVKRGDLIAVIDPRPYQATLDQAKAKQQQDEASLANARLDLVRFSSLARQDFASRQQVDTQQALVNQDIAAVAGDTAAIESAQLNLQYCYITSPLDGRVGLRLVDPGNLVHATDTTGIVMLTQIQPISVVFTLPQEELPQIQQDMTAGTLPVLAYSSDDRTKLSEGTLLTPNNSIDTSTGTIELKATFANQDNKLWPGQFVNARVQTSVEHNVVTIPLAGIEHGPDGLYVYVVKSDATVTDQPIAVGYQNDQLAVVTSGLNGGEQVVVDGQSRLQTGTKVAAKAAPSVS